MHTDGWTHWVPQNSYMFSTHGPLHGNNLHTMPKGPTTRLYLPSIRRKALGSQNLNSIIFFTRKTPIFKGSQSTLCHYINTYINAEPSLLWGMWNFLAFALLSYWKSFYHWLNYRKVFGRHPTGTLYRFFILFCSSGTLIGAYVDDRLTENFVHH